jgi:hypothetical protein
VTGGLLGVSEKNSSGKLADQARSHRPRPFVKLLVLFIGRLDYLPAFAAGLLLECPKDPAAEPALRKNQQKESARVLVCPKDPAAVPVVQKSQQEEPARVLAEHQERNLAVLAEDLKGWKGSLGRCCYYFERHRV